MSRKRKEEIPEMAKEERSIPAPSLAPETKSPELAAAPKGPELITLEYIGPYGRRKTPALVPDIGYVFYLEERTFDAQMAARLKATGEWADLSNRCKYIKLNGERCDYDRLAGSKFCQLHQRLYKPGDTAVQ